MTPLLVNREEAARLLSMSVDSFERYVLADLKVVRRGRLVLIPTAQLQGWVERSQAVTLERDR